MRIHRVIWSKRIFVRCSRCSPKSASTTKWLPFKKAPLQNDSVQPCSLKTHLKWPPLQNGFGMTWIQTRPHYKMSAQADDVIMFLPQIVTTKWWWLVTFVHKTLKSLQYASTRGHHGTRFLYKKHSYIGAWALPFHSGNAQGDGHSHIPPKHESHRTQFGMRSGTGPGNRKSMSFFIRSTARTGLPKGTPVKRRPTKSHPISDRQWCNPTGTPPIFSHHPENSGMGMIG